MAGTIDSSSIVWLLVLFVCLTLYCVMLGEGDCVVVNNINKKKRKTKPKIKPKSKCWTNKWKRTQHTSGQERTKYTETKMEMKMRNDNNNS